MSRPCKLQINQRGAWRDMLTFDLDAIDDDRQIQYAASNLLMLAGVSTTASLRIVMADSLQTGLMLWTHALGWREI